jgi:FixJ family two-component response regulator
MTPKIAVVDDDAGVRRAMRDLLRSLGYAVEHFSSAEQFLEWNSANQTSCIITDVRMPGIGGVEFQARLIAQGHRIPMIFMTAFPDENEKARVLNAGAIGFLPKPISQKSLVECLTRAFAASNLAYAQVSVPSSI